MFTTSGGGALGLIKSSSVSGRGFTPEELAESAVDKIIYIGRSSDPVIRAQAEAYREQIKAVLVASMHQAIRSNNTTLTNRFRAAGHPELVKLLEI
jgi:hypothetical protein